MLKTLTLPIIIFVRQNLFVSGRQLDFHNDNPYFYDVEEWMRMSHFRSRNISRDVMIYPSPSSNPHKSNPHRHMTMAGAGSRHGPPPLTAHVAKLSLCMRRNYSQDHTGDTFYQQSSNTQWRIHSGVVGVARPLGNHGNNLQGPICDPLGAGVVGVSLAHHLFDILSERMAAGRRRSRRAARCFFFSNQMGKTASFWPRNFFLMTWPKRRRFGPG